MSSTPPSPPPVFVLGLGAQKAGTTWLYAYLDHFARSDFGEIKEYHIWDGLYLGADRGWDTRPLRQPWRRHLRHLLQPLRGGPRDPFYIRQSFQRTPARYFDYFQSILSRDGIAITGDITPAYCGLEAEHLAFVKDGFAARDIPVRVVFLLREPVDRCLSAIRMFRRAGVSQEGVDISLPDPQALLAYLGTPNGQMRSDYTHTLNAIAAVFEPAETYIGFYESMFGAEAFDRLNSFFDLPPAPEFLERKFNTTKQGADLPAEVRQAAMQRLEPVYRDCFARYPELRGLWTAGAEAFPD